eukprot:Gb_35780 [translate_table: standard]
MSLIFYVDHEMGLFYLLEFEIEKIPEHIKLRCFPFLPTSAEVDAKAHISTIVKENNDLTTKYASVRNELQVFSSQHESEQKRANEREAILEGNLEDLKVKLDKPSGVDVHGSDDEPKLQLVDTKMLEQVPLLSV